MTGSALRPHVLAALHQPHSRPGLGGVAYDTAWLANLPAEGGKRNVRVISIRAQWVKAATESLPAPTEEVILGQPVRRVNGLECLEKRESTALESPSAAHSMLRDSAFPKLGPISSPRLFEGEPSPAINNIARGRGLAARPPS